MVSADQRVLQLEQILGYTFSNRDLAIQATTHPSAVDANPSLSYQRLEFLGDSIIGFLVARYAFDRYPSHPEGELTKMRIAVVNGNALAQAAERLGFGALIQFGASEPRSGSRGMKSALADVFEAVVAALYVDAGLDFATQWVVEQLGDHVNPDFASISSNPKIDLQERAQAIGRTVEYRVIGSSGPAHQPTFTSEVLVDGTPVASGSGTSKRSAEAAAAEEALARIEAEGAW